MTLPTLILRLTKGTPLTAAELDGNFTTLRDGFNGLAALLEVALNADGSLKDAAITAAAQITDRIITNDKLTWDFNFYAVATGTDNYAVTISPSSFTWAANRVIWVKFTNANTGACTLDVNASGTPKTIYKNGTENLVAGDIPAGLVMPLCYDGTAWHVGPIPGFSLAGATIAGTNVTPNNAAISAFDIDWSLVSNHGTLYKDISANAVFTFSNTEEGKNINVLLRNSNAPSYTLTWPAMKGLASLDTSALISGLHALMLTFTQVDSTIFMTACRDVAWP